jgi:hypothetical protein
LGRPILAEPVKKALKNNFRAHQATNSLAGLLFPAYCKNEQEFFVKKRQGVQIKSALSASKCRNYFFR